MSADPYAIVAERAFPGATLLRRRSLKGGVSATIEALDLAFPDGQARTVVVRRHAAEWKQNRGDVATTEFALHGALRRAGKLVPEPLFLDTSCEVLPSPYLVMEFVDGTGDVDENDLPDALRQMAEFLVRLHGLETGTGAFPALPPGDDPIAGALRYLPARSDWQDLRDVLASLAPGEARRCLLHGDFWPGNVLWKGGRIAAVVDWEDASVGDPLSDLACCRAELMCAYGADAVETFTTRYLAESHVDAFLLPVWDVYVSAAALASMGDWGLPVEVEAARRENTTRFLERAAREILTR